MRTLQEIVADMRGRSHEAECAMTSVSLNDISKWADELEQCQQLLTRFYNGAYVSGHHDTVEGTYADVQYALADTYHEQEAKELLENLAANP